MNILVYSLVAAALLLLSYPLIAGTFHSKTRGARRARRGGFETELDDCLAHLTESLREVKRLSAKLVSDAQSGLKSINEAKSKQEELERRQIKLRSKQRTPVATGGSHVSPDVLLSKIASGRKEDIKRDYMLFASGVLLTTIISVMLKWIGVL